MASTYETEEADINCASCGIAEVDEIKLKDCDACDLVRYCSEKCQEEHRPKHEAMCKERAAELRDEILFKQPESSYLGDCPICFLPLSLDIQRAVLQSCCSKWICDGCACANKLLREREVGEKRQLTCPFCRHPSPTSQEEAEIKYMKRVEKNDPVAMTHFGKKRCREGNYDTAFEYFAKAAELGDVEAYYNLSFIYQEGQGVEKDEKKRLYHLEQAAIGGHPDARYNLARKEGRNERFDRSVKHLIIAASLGHDGSIQMLKECYKYGDVSKEDFAAALRAHQAAVDAAKSPQRDAAEAFLKELCAYQQTTSGGNT